MALLHSWKPWADAVVINDPESLQNDGRYLRRVVLDQDDDADRWKLILLGPMTLAEVFSAKPVLVSEEPLAVGQYLWVAPAGRLSLHDGQARGAVFPPGCHTTYPIPIAHVLWLSGADSAPAEESGGPTGHGGAFPRNCVRRVSRGW